MSANFQDDPFAFLLDSILTTQISWETHRRILNFTEDTEFDIFEYAEELPTEQVDYYNYLYQMPTKMIKTRKHSKSTRKTNFKLQKERNREYAKLEKCVK